MILFLLHSGTVYVVQYCCVDDVFCGCVFLCFCGSLTRLYCCLLLPPLPTPQANRCGTRSNHRCPRRRNRWRRKGWGWKTTAKKTAKRKRTTKDTTIILTAATHMPVRKYLSKKDVRVMLYFVQVEATSSIDAHPQIISVWITLAQSYSCNPFYVSLLF